MYSLVACLSHLTIDHASLSIPSTVPTPNRHLQHLGAHYFLIHMLHRNVLLILSPSCFAVCGHHLSPRIAIVFSLLSSVPNFSMPHSSIFLISYHIPFLLVYFTFSHYVSSTLLRCHKCTSVHHLPPPLDYWYARYLFFLASPGPLHEIAVSAFSRSPLGRAYCIHFHSYFLR